MVQVHSIVFDPLRPVPAVCDGQPGGFVLQEERLSDVLGEFARTMLTDFPIQSILDHLVRRIVEVLPITSAGVTLISPGRDPHFIAASNEAALAYERLQTEFDEGPCLAAYRTGVAMLVPDLEVDHQFPTFGPRALEAGLRAVFTFPLRHGDNRLGALDLYRESTGTMSEQAVAAAQTLADVAAAYILNARIRDTARESLDQYRESALHDALTGLPNRVLLHQRLEHASQRARRSHAMLAVLFVDLDRFKAVNDMYGHHAGDDLLIAVADRLQRAVRSGDTVARMSGDEFVVLCEDLDEGPRIELLATRVVATMAEPFDLSGAQVNVTASVGIAFAGYGEHLPDQLLNDADEAMYQAKRAGGDRHQLIDLRERSRAAARTSLELDLRSAVSRGELRLDYQPIVRTADGEITGVEALLRWDHPERGLIPPNTIIPLAEQSDLIIDLGRWVLERACLDRNRLQGSAKRVHLQLAVNASPHELMGYNFRTSVEDVLSLTDTDPKTLTLEVTESVYVEDVERALLVLNDLKNMGVNIALDDFGTGFSSLSHLQRFPIDVVKIDRQFISQLGHEPVSVAIVSSIISLAHALERTVVAEGVETADQHETLSALDCDSCQGFYFAFPMSVDDLEQQLLLR